VISDLCNTNSRSFYIHRSEITRIDACSRRYADGTGEACVGASRLSVTHRWRCGYGWCHRLLARHTERTHISAIKVSKQAAPGPAPCCQGGRPAHTHPCEIDDAAKRVSPQRKGSITHATPPRHRLAPPSAPVPPPSSGRYRRAGRGLTSCCPRCRRAPPCGAAC